MVQASAAVAAACAPAWSSSAVYTKDISASQSGHNYTAKWWTQNESRPRTAASGTSGSTTAPAAAAPRRPPRPTDDTAHDTRPPPRRPRHHDDADQRQAGKNVVGYFAEWGVYGRNYHVKNIETSGSAAKLTHILYAFGNTTGGQCTIGDSYADYDKAYTAAESVDGVADTWDTGALRGSFNQLRKLKKQYPQHQGDLVVRRLDLVRRLHPGRGEPDRVRRTPATTWSRTRAGPTSSTASTSTGSTRTPAACPATPAARPATTT